MKTLHQQAKDLLAKHPDVTCCYIKRYYGEKDFRLSVVSGIKIPDGALAAMAEDPEYVQRYKLHDAWIPGDDEFLVAAHVKTATEEICAELEMSNFKVQVSPYSPNNFVRYWQVSFTYNGFSDSMIIFDLDGLRSFLNDVNLAYPQPC